MHTPNAIDDDMLSAYIDGELPPQEMQLVRAALVADATLALRFNALKLANDLVAQHALALDAVPLCASTLALLQTDSASVTPPPANVVRGPWRKRQTPLRWALAASLVAAFAVNFLRTPTADELPALAAYSTQLDTARSGTTLAVDAATLSSRFSFRDRANRYCRQYRLDTATAGAENIACRTAAGWTLVASLPDTLPAMRGNYQPASSSSELNAVLDSMMQGAALDLAAEAALIERGWQDASE